MIWKLILILILSGGEPVEFVGSNEFKSLAECNMAAMKIAQQRASESAVLTCVSFVQA